MLAIASQIILCLVLAALIGLIIGYLLGKANCPKDVYKAHTPVDSHTADDGDCGENNDDDNSTASVETDRGPEETEAEEEPDTAQSAETPQAVLDTDQESAESERPAEVEAEKTGEEASAPAQAQSLLTETTTGEKEASAPSDDDKPAGLLDAPEGEKDNLTRIKGIGVKIESQLNGIGVYHFRQIAAFTEKELSWVAHHTSFPGRALRDDWIGQAKLLAEGKETEFSKRVDAGEVASSHKS